MISVGIDISKEKSMAKIRSMLRGKGFVVVELPPPSGKDWNQYLQNTIKQEKHHGRPKEAAISL